VSSRVCIDMYILAIFLVGCVCLGMGIRELVSMNDEHNCRPCHDTREKYINSLGVNG